MRRQSIGASSCLLETDADRVFADRGGDLQVAVHGVPVVGWPTVDRHPAALRIDIADMESGSLPSCARSAGVGGDDQAPAVDIVPGLREADGGEVHAVDRWINELPQVGLVDQPPPGAFAPRFGDHHDGVVLTTGMRLTQPEPPRELTGPWVPGGLIVRLRVRLQCRIDGGVAEFPRNRQPEEGVPRGVLEARPVLAGLADGLQIPPAHTVSGGLEEPPRFVALLGQELERQRQAASRTYSV